MSLKLPNTPSIYPDTQSIVRKEMLELLNGFIQQVVNPRIAVIPYHVAALSLVLDKLAITSTDVDAKYKAMLAEAESEALAKAGKANGESVVPPAPEDKPDMDALRSLANA